MHPPFDRADAALWRTVARLQGDRFLMDRVLHHNPSYGYNTFESYVEEDSVRALDQLVCERLGIAQDPRARWTSEDGGMHVLAAVLYSIVKAQRYNQRGETYGHFLVRIIDAGILAPGKVQQIYNAFYGQ